MSRSLVIVESPAKARAIQQYLGADYDVRACMGHVMDLTKKDGVVIEKKKKGAYEFTPTLAPIKGKEKVVTELKKLAKEASEVFLAPDPDREGEAIAYHIAELLSHKKTRRVLFHEITKAAVKEAFQHPREIDKSLVESQQARRILDRIVGFDISQLLWEKVARGLSAGRVQTVALKLLVDREREIRRFVPVESWTISARLEKDEKSFLARLVEKDGKKLEIADEKGAKEILAGLKPTTLEVSNVAVTERRRNAAPPFITSTLQQEAARRLGYPVAITMKLAQGLYEGVELPEGLTGLITYMRTDSVRVAESAIEEARGYIREKLGAKYLPESPNRYKTNRAAQDAHEAIRPTSVMRTPASLANVLDKKAHGLYKLIWSRFVASQCLPAVYEALAVDLKQGDCRFRANGSTLKFQGFLKVYADPKVKEEEDAAEDADDQKLPSLAAGEKVPVKEFLPEQHFTHPPPRYSEAALVKALEEKGIGRPSTYASIISTLKNRQYTSVVSRRLFPTDLGMSVTDLLVEQFPDIFNMGFTAEMEKELDDIEESHLDWQKVLNDFYKEFERDMKSASEKMPNLKAGVPTEHRCPTCNQVLLLRYGKMGRFLACSGYPDCTTTFEVVEAADGSLRKLSNPEFKERCPRCGEAMAFKRSRFGAFLACRKYPDCRGVIPLRKIDEDKYEIEVVPEVTKPCPQCGGKLEVKKSRFGRFLACMKYPECKGSLPFLVNVACPMPDCDGELCERTSRRGIFYACLKFPGCRFRTFDEPVRATCPVCSAPAMFRSKGQLRCGRPGCEGTAPDPKASAPVVEETSE